jgi:hypothetical protein
MQSRTTSSTLSLADKEGSACAGGASVPLKAGPGYPPLEIAELPVCKKPSVEVFVDWQYVPVEKPLVPPTCK